MGELLNEMHCNWEISNTLAAPVELGMMFCAAPRPPRQSFIEGPSTVFCVAGHQQKIKDQTSWATDPEL